MLNVDAGKGAGASVRHVAQTALLFHEGQHVLSKESIGTPEKVEVSFTFSIHQDHYGHSRKFL